MIYRIVPVCFLVLFLFSAGAFAADSKIVIHFDKGWNLVPALSADPDGGINSCGTYPNMIPRTNWLYSPVINKWGGSNPTTNQNLGDLAAVATQFEADKSKYYYAAIMSTFTFIEQACDIQSTWHDNGARPDQFNFLRFAPGWNFVPIIPQMAGQKFADAFGKCSLGPNVYFWNGGWLGTPVSRYSETTFLDSDVGRVMLLKFQGECNLNLSPGPGGQVPALPEN